MNFQIIDVHMHMGQEPTYTFMNYGLDNLLCSMDKLGIGYCINANLNGMRNLFERADTENREIFKESKGRILSYFCFTPNCAERALEIIRKNKDNRMYKGIKIHPSEVGIDADDDRWIPVWEVAREYHLPIMAHTWTRSAYHPSQNCAFAGKFERFVSAYPDVTFTFAHSGGRYEGVIEAARITKDHKNCYVDIAGDINGLGVLDYLYETVGPDRIMYGSDNYMIEHRPMIGMVLANNKMTISDKEKIFRYNAERVYFSEERL